MHPLLPLALTTSDRVDSALEARAREASIAVSAPFIPRQHKLPLSKLLREVAEALVVFESNAVSLVDREGSLRFSPGLAHLRVKQLDAGVREDLLLVRAGLQAGDAILDCTLGLAADAQVASRLVGPGGQVVALEKSAALYLLTRHGLAGLPRHPDACEIDVRHADAHAFLRAAPTGSFDVVLFDPMFERPCKSSAAFEVLRRHAEHAPLTRETLTEAQRVARRAVFLKGARYSSDFKKLGVTPAPARRSATVLWALLPGSSPQGPHDV